MQKGETATVKFPDVEAKIAKDCDRYFSLKNIGPSKLQLADAEIAAVFSRYQSLSRLERRLRFEGKSVPGYTASPETKRFLACDTKMRDAIRRTVTCDWAYPSF